MRTLVVAGLVVALLVPLPWSAAAGDEFATECVELRGHTRNVSLQNTCDRDINAYACCYGDGALGSCQRDSFELVAIQADEIVNLSSCDNQIGYAACNAPYELNSSRWDAGYNTIMLGQCVTTP